MEDTCEWTIYAPNPHVIDLRWLSIKARSLPRFWFYSFHYMDYQKYAFELLTNVRCTRHPLCCTVLTNIHFQSDFRGLAFRCSTITNGVCTCAYPSSTPETCTVSGGDILEYLDIGSVSYGKWAAILVCINIIYRIVLVVQPPLFTAPC